MATRWTLPTPDENRWTFVQTGPWQGVGETTLVEAAGETLLTDPLAWLQLEESQTLKESRNTLARVPRPDGKGDLLLKVFPVRPPLGTIQSGWRKSKAHKAWKKAWTLIARGIETPHPRLALERRFGGVLVASALWVDWVEGRQLREVLKPWRRRPRDPEETAACHEFLRTMALYLRRMHDAGTVHRDFGGGNVLLPPRPSEEPWSLVDINRAQLFAGPAPWPARMLDLERVHLHPEDRPHLFQAYVHNEAERAQWGPVYLRRAKAYRPTQD
jgi:Lipopolysaccharide kinase (Kdo/WaaP) family